MLIIIYSLLFIILAIIALFSFPQFSPIPYFPTNKKDLPLIIKALNLKNNQIVFDLGAGDGGVIFAAASQAYKNKLNTQFIAVDINPVLILIMHFRCLFHPNKKNIKIVWGDMFKYGQDTVLSLRKTMKQCSNVTIYLYVSPWFLEKIIENCKLKIENFTVVSYMYPLPNVKPQKILRGKNKIFVYKI